MVLFIQTFRFAAEPFFFDYYKNKDDRGVYADVMKYFIVFMGIIFLGVIIFYDVIIGFLGPEYRDHPNGLEVVSILLLANLFLGILFNLSIWYKLTEKTIYGAYISIFGALITVLLNFILIPKIGILGSAWATLACYFNMALVSYFLGKKHFPIPYQKKKGFILFDHNNYRIFYCYNRLSKYCNKHNAFVRICHICIYFRKKEQKNKIMNVKIINKSKHDLPKYSTPSAAGMDLRANLSLKISLKPLERKIINTGIFIELPKGYEAQVRPRSGLAFKKGITVLNSPGTN